MAFFSVTGKNDRLKLVDIKLLIFQKDLDNVPLRSKAVPQVLAYSIKFCIESVGLINID